MARNLFEASGRRKHWPIPDGMVGYQVTRPLNRPDKVKIGISQSVMKEAGIFIGDKIIPIWDHENEEMILEKCDKGFMVGKKRKIGLIKFTYKKAMGIPTSVKRTDFRPMIMKNKTILCISSQEK